tara:strand:+ start:172 stop:612 length:441 start_codon:yes stop_codon:yes gene_type:complete
MSASLLIGDLARRTGCKVQTIRYYEQIGLMPEPARTEGRQRRYGLSDADRLAFIRHGRELGLGLDAIRELLELSDAPDKSCEAADQIVRNQLREVESRLRRLVALKKELKRIISNCAGGKVADCRVIQSLADHSECLSADHTTPAL